MPFLAGLRRKLRKGRSPPLAGDLAGLSCDPGEARCAEPTDRGCTAVDRRYRAKPLRLAEVETFLRGAAISPERLEQAADMPASFVASRTRQQYRREVVRGVMLRGLINASRSAGADLTMLAPELEVACA